MNFYTYILLCLLHYCRTSKISAQTAYEIEQVRSLLSAYDQGDYKHEIIDLLSKINSKLDKQEKNMKEVQHTIDSKATSRVKRTTVPFNETAMIQLHHIVAPKSCHDWLRLGFTAPGNYLIDPDGKMSGEPPFSVECDMFTGTTKVHHSTQNVTEVPPCKGPGCFTTHIHYKATKKQLLALTHISESCRQSVKLECLKTPLQKNNKMYSWWTDLSDRKHYYWAGTQAGTHTCACGISSGCTNHKYSCNCDAYENENWQTDSGFLADASSLPVTTINFGADETGEPLQLKYELGPLLCFGRKEKMYPMSCMDLWVRGVSYSGYYHVGIPDSVKLIYCDMDKMPDDENFELEIALEEHDMESLKNNMSAVANAFSVFQNSLAQNTWKVNLCKNTLKQRSFNGPKRIAFNAWSTKSTSPGNYIIFDNVTVNDGSHYNPTTGFFKAPSGGVYLFAFHVISKSGSNFNAFLKKNDEDFGSTGITRSWSNMGITSLIELEADDKVGVFLGEGEYNYRDIGATLFVGANVFTATPKSK